MILDAAEQVLDVLTLLANGFMAAFERLQGIGQKARVLLLDAFVGLDGVSGVAEFFFELTFEEARAHAVFVGIERLAQMAADLDGVIKLGCLLGQLTVIMGELDVQGFVTLAVELLGDVGGLLPLALLFKDGEQVTHADRSVLAALFDQFFQQTLGAIEQARLEIIAGEFEAHGALLLFGEVGPGQQILVNADGAVDFAPLPEQAADDQIGVGRFAVDLEGFEQDIDGFVALVVEQQVDALEVFACKGVAGRTGSAAALHFAEQPANDNGRKQQAVDQQIRQAVSHVFWH